MLTLLRTISLSYFARHKTRTALVTLSIALGVAVLVATQALSRGLGGGIQDGVNPLAGLADLVVVKGQNGVPMGLAEEIRQVEGVSDAQPQVMWLVTIKELDNAVAWMIGVDFKSASKKGSFDLGEDNELGVQVKDVWKPTTVEEFGGLFVAQPALVSESLARQFAKKNATERTFTIRNAGFTPQATRVGTIDFSTSKLPLKESHVLLMDVRSASAIAFPEKPDHVHQIAVRVTPGADIREVRQRLADRLGESADVQTLDVSRQLVADVFAGLEVGLAIGGAGALVVGLFLVYIILSVSVAERRHDIGIMRAVGATRQQIAGLFIAEAAVLGLVGSSLGLPLGWFLAWLACKPMASFISELLVKIDSAQVQLPAWLIFGSVLAGTTVAMLAALVPAMQAAREEPADAVRRVPVQNQILYAILQIVATIALLSLGFAFARFRYALPHRVGMFCGIVCLFVGGLISTPVLAGIVGRLVQPFFRHFLGLEGRLAADNLVRSPVRTGLVIAVLGATVALMVQTAGFIKSTRDSIREWVDEKVAADLFVTSGAGVTSGGASLQMRDDMRAKLLAVPGVESVLPIRFQRVDYVSPADARSRIVFIVALDTRTFSEAVTEGPLAKNMKRYLELGLDKPGSVIVSENFAALYKISVGDEIQFPGGGQKAIRAKVVGVATDYTWNRGTIIMDLDWFRKEYNDQQVDVFDLFLKPGHDPNVVREEILRRHGNEHVLFAATRPEFNAEVSSTLNKVYGLAYAQQSVVGLVALLGVVVALFISVLQRKRDLGLLRAVGATRGQILRSVLAEAVLMGIVGSVVGFGIGLLLEWYVLDVMIFDEAGFQFAMRIPWMEAGVVAAVAVTLATLAGLWPAYQATLLRIPEAIAYE